MILYACYKVIWLMKNCKRCDFCYKNIRYFQNETHQTKYSVGRGFLVTFSSAELQARSLYVMATIKCQLYATWKFPLPSLTLSGDFLGLQVFLGPLTSFNTFSSSRTSICIIKYYVNILWLLGCCIFLYVWVWMFFS